jgi:hypothetical protein
VLGVITYTGCFRDGAVVILVALSFRWFATWALALPLLFSFTCIRAAYIRCGVLRLLIFPCALYAMAAILASVE